MLGFVLRRMVAASLSGAKGYAFQEPERERRIALAVGTALAMSMRIIDRWPKDGEATFEVLQAIQDQINPAGADLLANEFINLQSRLRSQGDRASMYGVTVVANWFKMISELHQTQKPSYAGLAWKHREYISHLIDTHRIKLSDEAFTRAQLGIY